jgi:hypothetical protein
MNKLFFLALLISSGLYAQTENPITTTTVDEDKGRFNPRKNHWLVTFGFEGMKYETPFDFEGVEKTFKPSTEEFWGGRLGFGGELYLGAGFMTATKVEGYYVGTLFARRLNAGPDDEDEEVSYSKQTGQIFGVDVVQSLSYLIDFKTKNPFMEEWAYLTLEPFIEAGIGRAYARNRVDYNYETGPTVDEGYKMKVQDDIVNARIGGGVNLTANTGFFLYARAHINTFDVTQRKTKEFTRFNQLPGTSVSAQSSDVKLDPITTYAIGGGYKF